MTEETRFTAGSVLMSYLAESPRIPDIHKRFSQDGNASPGKITVSETVDHLVDRYCHMIRNAFPLMHSDTWFMAFDTYNSRTEIGTEEILGRPPVCDLVDMLGLEPEEIQSYRERSDMATNSVIRAIDELDGLTALETIAMIHAIEHWWGGGNRYRSPREFLAHMFFRPESLVFSDDFENYEEALLALWEFEEIGAEGSDANDPSKAYYQCTHRDYEGLEATVLYVKEPEQEYITLINMPSMSRLTSTHYMMGVDPASEIIHAWFNRNPR